MNIRLVLLFTILTTTQSHTTATTSATDYINNALVDITLATEYLELNHPKAKTYYIQAAENYKSDPDIYKNDADSYHDLDDNDLYK